MAASQIFKVPETIPQDLLLIQDLVGKVPSQTGKAIIQEESDDPIDSSDNDSESEAEVEADLGFIKPEADDVSVPAGPDSQSDSASDTDSNSEDEEDAPTANAQNSLINDEDDEDASTDPTVVSANLVHTKNEITEVKISIPDIDEVGPDEPLEKVGEIMSIVNDVVVVKGISSGMVGKASDRALDSDTLLVFEDRKVLGFIYETFGPTYNPLYQIRFNSAYPLNPEKVRIPREVFHIPRRSKFVFVSQIRSIRGSDASNIHDEEPAEDEIEFSDDEQESAFKSARKNARRSSRSVSVASSRHSTPLPAQMRDQDMVEIGYDMNPYDAHGPYDVDNGNAGPSRPAPIPYDDPYSDIYTAPPSVDSNTSEFHAGEDLHGSSFQLRAQSASSVPSHQSHTRSRGKGRDDGNRRRGVTTRPRGRGRGRNHKGSSNWRREDTTGWSNNDQYPPQAAYGNDNDPIALSNAQMDSRLAAPQSPLEQGQTTMQPHMPSMEPWSQPTYQPSGYGHEGFQQPYIQPHINPRFVSALGINMGFMQAHPPYGLYNQFNATPYNPTGHSNGGQWVVPMEPPNGDGQN